MLTTGLSWAVVRLDERRMKEPMLERAWPPSSRDAAVIAFGPLALPFHFARTRGHFRTVAGVAWIPLGFLLGVAALALVLFASDLVLEGLAWVFGLPDQ